MTSGDHDERNQPDGLDDEAPPEIPDISSDPPPSGPAEAAEPEPIDPGLERRLSPPPKPRGRKRDPARSRTAPQTPVARSVPPPKPSKPDSDGGLEGAHLKAPSLPNIDQPASTQRSETQVGAPAPPPRAAMGSESGGEAPVVVPPRAPMGSQPPRPVSEPPRRVSQPPPKPARPLSRPPPAEETNDAGWDDAPPPRTEPPPADDGGQPEAVKAQQPATPSADEPAATESEAAAETETTAAEGEPEAVASAKTEAEGAEAESEPAQGETETAASTEEEGASAQAEPEAAGAESGSGEAEPTGDAPRPKMITVPDDDIPPETPPSGKSPIQVMKIIAIGDGRPVGAPPELADTEALIDDAAELDEAEVIPAEEASDLSQKAPPPPKRKGPTPPPPPSRAERQAAKQRSRMESAAGQRQQQRRPWWEELFGEEYHRSMTRLSDRQVKREANFIEESLGVAPGGVVLDLGCGAGYHAVELAHRGYGVVGYDLSLFQLALAAEVAQERGQKINFLQGDMREMAFEEMFDGIYCWNTTFGYFEEEKNFAVAQRIFKALRPGGMFLLDVTNRDFAVAHQPSQVWYEGDACVCMDDMSVDFITSRLKVKRSMIMDDGRTRECTYSVRLYALHELGKIFHDVGFRVTEASGHPATPGVFFGLSSPRIIILAQRP